MVCESNTGSCFFTGYRGESDYIFEHANIPHRRQARALLTSEPSVSAHALHGYGEAKWVVDSAELQ